MAEVYDLAVIGGGINGCGIARDAAGRGASVYLCEMNDLASGTSSLSTKLIHGGLRYLEHYEFRLVREALIEREVLWRQAPHIITPMRFVLPHHEGLRPAWLLRLGLFLYDHLGGRKLLAPTKTLDLTLDEAGRPLKPEMFARGFEYSDCRVDDARLVVLNALDAHARGAVIETRTAAIAAERLSDEWCLLVENRYTGERRDIRARALVNAAGPWVAGTLSNLLKSKEKPPVRLVQGSHIVVSRLYDHDRAYIFQNADGRVIFAIPFERDFTLIGTTDRDYRGDPADAKATADEIAYLTNAASDYFAEPVTPRDVVWTYSGVRPLYDAGASEAKAATRDYVFDMDAEPGQPPLLSVYGGKITTYRRLAEAVLARLASHLPALKQRIGWTANAVLPGGDIPLDGVPALAASYRHAHTFLSQATAERLARSYGTRARNFLRHAKHAKDLGRDFGAGLSEVELRYLMASEWAMTAEDVLWRRSKLGLRMSTGEATTLAAFMAAETGRAIVATMASARRTGT